MTATGSASTPEAGGSPTPGVGSAAAGSWEDVGRPPCDFGLADGAGVLGDGSVLVNGCATEGAPAFARWHPDRGDWTPAASLERMRSEYAMLGLRDGRALVIGGYNGDDASYSSVYAYDGDADAWTKVGLLDAARTAPAAVQLADGRVLVVGGYFWQRPSESAIPSTMARLASWSGPATDDERPAPDDVDVPPHGYALATAELFDPATGTSEKTGSMRYARSGPAITMLADGRVLVVGGSSDAVTGISSQASTTAEIFDPATGAFTSAGSMPELDQAAFEEPGRNPIPDEPPLPGSVGQLAALPDGGAVLVGQTSWWKHVADLTRSFRFDAHAGSWHEIGETYVYVGEPTGDVLTTPGVPSLGGVLVGTTGDGTVVRAGGQGPSEADGSGYSMVSSDEAAAFDPATDQWIPVLAAPTAFEQGVAVELQDGSILFVVGWRTTSGDSEEVPSLRFIPGAAP